MTNSQRYLFATLALAAICATVFLAIVFAAQPQRAEATAGGSDTTIIKATTAASTTVSASASTQIMATSTSRVYAMICNDDPSDILFLNFGNNAALDKGIRVSAGNCFEIGRGNRFTGAVNGIASSTAINVSQIEVSGAQTFGN